MSSMTDLGAATRRTGAPMSRAEFVHAYSFGGATSSNADVVNEPTRPHRYLDLSVWDRVPRLGRISEQCESPEVSVAEPEDEEVDDDGDEAACWLCCWCAGCNGAADGRRGSRWLPVPR